MSRYTLGSRDVLNHFEHLLLTEQQNPKRGTYFLNIFRDHLRNQVRHGTTLNDMLEIVMCAATLDRKFVIDGEISLYNAFMEIYSLAEREIYWNNTPAWMKEPKPRWKRPPMSAEHRAAISASTKGRVHSPEARQKMADARRANIEAKRRSKGTNATG